MADVTLEPIRRLLIANRGEIARRVIRSAQEMGMDTVAVYADGDVAAPFVRDADVAIALGGRAPGETYLNVEKIIEACRRGGADAVHPGYGFLAENAEFAEAVERAGLRWVGPGAAAIRAMGDKLAAKELMAEAGVPTLGAIELTVGGDAAAAAKEIGYPVLVKAAAGGGGRGMRIVEAEAELTEAVEGARREAQNAFGDDRLFLERWLPKVRHVEVQILGDRQGNVVHLFERECSVQRRHQKIIEEAPSPAVDARLRTALGSAAVAAAKKIGYVSAGTVEFLLAGDEFFFLEVNTRLQVEHPVTEEITGLDLVREQLRIAEGEALGYTQDDLSFSGHAIEARLYAEDPANDFLPAAGKLIGWAPPSREKARFDSGVEEGSDVSVEFDPLIAKVIAHAPSRREAAGRLARVLAGTRVQGVVTNRDFLVATLRTPEFLAGDTTTDFIERVNPGRTRAVSDEELSDAAVATVIYSQAENRRRASVLQSVPSGWRNSIMPPETVRFRYGEAEIPVEYRSRRDGSFEVNVDGAGHQVRVFRADGQGVDIEIDGRREQLSVRAAGDRWLLQGPQGGVELVELPRFPTQEHAKVAGGLTAPMPGKVTVIHVRAGDAVTKGQLLMGLEAMKMEHRIEAPGDGIVKEVLVSEGEQVDNGALLVVVEA